MPWPWPILSVTNCLPQSLLAATLLACFATAQQVRPDPPMGVTGAEPPADPLLDRGVPPRMFENPNLDRYLRRAQSFLEAAKYVDAIEVLQDVIQGRTVEFVSTPVGTATAGADTPEENGGPKPPEPVASAVELDAGNSVFSLDSRLYRPVRRLCHEMLARLPAHGVELYRTMFEVAADELYEQALASGSKADLEEVVRRYFVTVPAGKAMLLLADRYMHEGRYRSAVQVLRDLVEVYPAGNRGRAGVNPVWCEFKVALCLHMAGEQGLANEAVQRLAAAHPEDSLRILGELQSVKDFPALAMFAADVVAVGGGAAAGKGGSWLEADTTELIPLWHHRYVDPDPYRRPASNSEGGVSWHIGGQRTCAMPRADRYGPASWIRFVPGDEPGSSPQALFLDHFRLRVAEARTGILLRETEERLTVPDPKPGYPRIRIAANDFALLRPVEDGELRYVVVGYDRKGTGVPENEKVLEASRLLAYDRHTLAPKWSPDQFLDGEDGLREVTFLAAPTVFGERLLLPALRAGAYTLECLDRLTGRPIWHTRLHADGSEFFKAPGVPVKVSGGVAYVLTNAGCLAAVDAFAGALRWIRRYERDDPLRPKPLPASSQEEGYGPRFTEERIAGFFPNDLVVRGGLVVAAPCDGTVLLCVDGASGEVVWLLDGQCRQAPYGNLETILGATDRDLFVASAEWVVGIDLRGGLVKWAREIGKVGRTSLAGRGHGVVLGEDVLIPGDREVLVLPTSGEGALRRLPLPEFGVGQEPLAGPFNIVSSGPWLGVGFQGGAEVFSTPKALRRLAADERDPVRRANLLVQARDEAGAERLLRDWLGGADAPGGPRVAGELLLLALVRARAIPLASDGRLADALAELDDIAGLCTAREARLGWHLARIEACKETDDLAAHEAEQLRLYDYMEGRTR